MAAPISKDTQNLAGTWELNRKLSDDPDRLFALQGVPWVIRKILRYANLSLQIAQAVTTPDNKTESSTESSLTSTSNSNSVTTLHIKQVVHPGGFDSEGSYPVNGEAQEVSLPIFGDITMQLSYISVDDVPDEAIRKRLNDESSSQLVIDEVAHNKMKGWKARVMWGFEMIDGKRYFTRNAISTKDDETVIAKMVYDFRN